MQIDLDLHGRPVLVLGTAQAARHVLRRLEAEGARPIVHDPDLDSGLDQAGRGLRATRWLDRFTAVRLVITVGLEPGLGAAVQDAARDRGLFCTSEEPAASTGSVILVGGGPGRTGLLTLDGSAALRDADVVVFDRLAPIGELATLAPGAELVDVGKTPGHHPVGQRAIEALLVRRARDGETVVRLKGGDSFVFGRGGEEVQACVAAGVPVRVIPGVTSALAVPAGSGIPVTHRGLSMAVTVISGHVSLPQQQYQALADLGQTIVIMMGVTGLAATVDGLRAAGMSAATPVAAIERGFSPTERTTITTLGDLVDRAVTAGIGSPAVLVIGEVVRLAGSTDLLDQIDLLGALELAGS